MPLRKAKRNAWHAHSREREQGQRDGQGEEDADGRRYEDGDEHCHGRGGKGHGRRHPLREGHEPHDQGRDDHVCKAEGEQQKDVPAAERDGRALQREQEHGTEEDDEKEEALAEDPVHVDGPRVDGQRADPGRPPPPRPRRRGAR